MKIDGSRLWQQTVALYPSCGKKFQPFFILPRRDPDMSQKEEEIYSNVRKNDFCLYYNCMAKGVL